MARGTKTGGRDFKPGEGGRKPGSRNKIPRSVKASLQAVLEGIEKEHAGDIKAGLLAGIRARPPKSFPYLQLALHYQVGKPADKLVLTSPDPLSIILSSCEHCGREASSPDDPG